MKRTVIRNPENAFNVRVYTEFLPTELGKVVDFINECLYHNYLVRVIPDPEQNRTYIYVNKDRYVTKVTDCLIYPEWLNAFTPDEVPGDRIKVLCLEQIDPTAWRLVTKKYNITNNGGKN